MDTYSQSKMQELQELKRFAAGLQGLDAEDIIYSLMKLQNNAERNGEEKAERKTQELMQLQFDAAERKTRELMQLQFDAAERNSRELMQLQIGALNLRMDLIMDEAKREVSNRFRMCLD